MTMIMSRVILITLLIFIIHTGQSKAETPSGTGSRHLIFFETGGLLGVDTELPYTLHFKDNKSGNLKHLSSKLTPG